MFSGINCFHWYKEQLSYRLSFIKHLACCIKPSSLCLYFFIQNRYNWCTCIIPFGAFLVFSVDLYWLLWKISLLPIKKKIMIIIVKLSWSECIFHLQASEDAKKLVSQERSFACAEIESARAVVQRFGEALEEQEKNSQASEKQVLLIFWSKKFVPLNYLIFFFIYGIK